MGKVVTSVKIDEELWKEAKIYAIQNGITFAETLDRALRALIMPSKKQMAKAVAK